MRAEFSAVGFDDRTQAETNLARLAARLAPGLLAPLAALLQESPDPDGALHWLERYGEGAPPDVLAALTQHPTALTYLVTIFGTSAPLAETLLAEPGLALQFARDRNFSRLKSKEEFEQDYARFTTINPDHWLSAQLARFKRRQTVRIALKEVLGLATLGETALELSALADVILNEALNFCEVELAKRYGHPQYRDVEGRIAESGFAVISLGQLGGRELDYGSDMDLIFIYAQEGETFGGTEPYSVISNKDYFVGLAQAVSRTLTQTTPAGEAFRVTLGHRAEGELAISLASATAYYRHRAGDRELQALIRSRHSAGDAYLTRHFLRSVAPFVYGAPNAEVSFDGVSSERPTTRTERQEAGEKGLDVNLDRGGICEIESLTLRLQRLHGHSDAWIRSGGTLLGMRKLNDKGWLSDRDYADLTAAYGFLRKVDHRIQLEHGHEPHRLPSEPGRLRQLGRQVGLDASGVVDEGKNLVLEVRKVFEIVTEIHDRLIAYHPRSGSAPAFDLMPRSTWRAGPGPRSFESLIAVLDAQAPNLADVLRQGSFPERSRRNVMRLFTAFLSSAERFHQARENPELVRSALEAAAMSEPVAEILADHPDDLVAFHGVRTLGPSEKARDTDLGFPQLVMPLDSSAWIAPFGWAAETGVSLSDQMALLRSECRVRATGLAAADLAGMTSIYSSLERWSALAAQAVASALAIAQSSMEGGLKDRARASPIGVLALGRLGQNEFDIASDVELVFVCEAGRSEDEFGRDEKLALRAMEVLSNYTRDGSVLAVEPFVVPSGGPGSIVVAEEALLAFLRNSAGARDVMTFVKALPIAGDEAFARRVAKRVAEACRERFARDRAPGGRIPETCRLKDTETGMAAAKADCLARGYDELDFAINSLRLRHQVEVPPGTNTSGLIAALRSRGLVTEGDSEVFCRGASFLLAVDHALRLVTGKAAESLPEHPPHAESMETLSRRWNLLPDGGSLSTRLREVLRQVRGAIDRLAGAE